MIDCNVSFSKCLLEKKTYGLCQYKEGAYYRNYKRILKNGKGLNLLEAVYAMLCVNYPEDFKPLFCGSEES